jgi:membrane protein implicated in regulation of membrane protease activity
MNPWIWAIGTLVVAVAEMVTPGFYLIWIAAGGAVTALASFAFDLSLTAQLFIFAVATALACVCGYFLYRKTLAPAVGDATLNQRDLEMIGTRGTVFEALTNGSGKVKLGDSVWLAAGPDLPAGAPVVVTGMRGTMVIVSPQ